MKPENILLSEKFPMRLAAAIVDKAVAGAGKNFTYEEGIRHGADVVLDELIRALKDKTMTMSTEQLTSVPNESPFAIQTFEHAQRVAKMLAASSLIPKEFQGNIQNVMIALEMANRIGASPLMVMQNLYIVHGKPSWSSAFIISAINSCGRFDPLRFDVSGAGDDLRCVAWTTEKGKSERIEGPPVTMKMAHAEGWVSKNGSKWKTMPELMIRYRAAAFFGRLYAPEITMGMQTREEVVDVSHVEVNGNGISAEEKSKAKEAERITLLIQDAKTLEELEQLQEFVPENQLHLFEEKKEELKAK